MEKISLVDIKRVEGFVNISVGAGTESEHIILTDGELEELKKKIKRFGKRK